MTDGVWDIALRYSEYSKGAMYSVSDVIADPMMVKLRLENPECDEVATKDKTSSNIGSACHSHWEKALDRSDVYVKTEVALRYKNLSGTADMIFEGGLIADWKTGKESNIKSKLRDPTKWIQQLSLYSYLLYKEHNIPMNGRGHIYWLSTDTGKYGVAEYDLLSEEEVLKLIKTFMNNMKKPIEQLPQCNLCVQFMHRWCSCKSRCIHWGLRDNQDVGGVDEW